ncbi:MAG TPA: hypothetical protein VFC80_04665 [Sphaerochaeta sp.]|nr:hypothetical protein [Sphaerochaeta sp.]
MNRVLAVMLLVVLITPTLFAATALPEYTPYEKDEFPLWTYKLHRGERIFFGSMLITIPVTILALNLAERGGLISAPSTELGALARYGGVAAGLSLGVALADFIIGEVQSR